MEDLEQCTMFSWLLSEEALAELQTMRGVATEAAKTDLCATVVKAEARKRASDGDSASASSSKGARHAAAAPARG